IYFLITFYRRETSMHISKLSLINYRNFLNAKLLFSKGINTLIGENGSGKTNLFKAIRLLLDNSMPRSAIRLKQDDFCRKLGDWRGHWIIISLEFDDIKNDEVSQSLFIHGVGNIENQTVAKATYNLIFRPKANIRQALGLLTENDDVSLNGILDDITINDYETVITGKSSADFNSPEVYRRIVGDFDRVIFPRHLQSPEAGSPIPNILSMSDEVSFTFVKALRDVVYDFRNNRTNPLLTLLKHKSGEIDPTDFIPIAALVESLNSSIEGLPDVSEIKVDIKNTIDAAVGDTYSPKTISIKSGLSDEAEQLFQSLKLFVDESDDGHEGSIDEMSLGGANLIYLTLKLLEFKYQKANQSIANFLLIEEPEAHIHTHIQKSLFDKINYPNTQIIYSTHSSHLSEVSKISSVNIIGKVNGLCTVFQPSTGLTSREIGFVERYLDAIRSNLLFAKSVILVEGDAEEILIPILIKQVLGVSLDELGITLVNMRSTGFENIALLFHDERIKKKCSIITDLDALFFDATEITADTDVIKKRKKKARGSQQKGAARKVALDAFCNDNDWISPFYAQHTFEVDFIKSDNKNYFLNILNDVYSDASTISTSKEKLSSNNIDESGQRALTMANHQGKGWFAITLGKVIDFNVNIPDYIIDAVLFSHGSFSDDIIFKIIKYRFTKLSEFIQSERHNLSELPIAGNEKYHSDWDNYLRPLELGIETFTPKWTDFLARGINIRTLKNNMLVDITLTSSNNILRKI
ncbi:MAG: AAA family ATPase, partial [Colwellia sp.]|nr:AAA family ATPase [Colwellia sp.]